jgi:hypothetical protein
MAGLLDLAEFWKNSLGTFFKIRPFRVVHPPDSVSRTLSYIEVESPTLKTEELQRNPKFLLGAVFGCKIDFFVYDILTIPSGAFDRKSIKE